MWDSLTKTSVGVAGCKECEAAATGCRSGCSSAPVTVERDRDWLWIRTKMPVCIWPETCLLGCSSLHDHLVSTARRITTGFTLTKAVKNNYKILKHSS